MQFKENHVYHVYNRGNNKEPVFLKPDNYEYFLRKIRNEWVNHCDIIAYCLMPNHFHFLIMPNEEGCKYVSLGGRESLLQKLSRTMGKTLSSYTRAINKNRGTTGNLFQQKTKSKNITKTDIHKPVYHLNQYLRNCFHYIHKNPVSAGLTVEPGDWPYSSFKEYLFQNENPICNTTLGLNVLRMNLDDVSRCLDEPSGKLEW